MRAVWLRLFRILLVALLASGALVWAEARGQPRLGWAVAAALFALLLAFDLRRRFARSRRTREARWEAALFAPEKRERAIAQLRRAVARLDPERPSTRSEHTRLSLLLCDLLDASGDYEAARAVVDPIAIDALSPIDAALVRHTRAVTHLRASDTDGALDALRGRVQSGDIELDQRLSLLEVYARMERGEPEPALVFASELEGMRGIDDSVALEARVVRAAALDALGRREEALVALAALGRTALEPLSDLGQPRVRALAAQVLAGLEP